MTPFWKRRVGKTVPKLDRRQAWQQAALRVGGTFVEGKRKSQDRVALEHGSRTIRLDTYTVHTGQVSITFTRVWAFFIGRADLKLVVRKRNFFDTILENLGFGGIVPRNRELARRYGVSPVPSLGPTLASPVQIRAHLLGSDASAPAVGRGRASAAWFRRRRGGRTSLTALRHHPVSLCRGDRRTECLSTFRL